MESTQIIKHVDRLGRFKLPSEWLNTYDITPGSPLKLTRGKARIVISSEVPKCIFCLSPKNIHTFKNKYVCKDCSKKIGNVLAQRELQRKKEK